MAIKFTINIPPHPQERPRFRRVGNFVQTYDPPNSKAYKKKVENVARLYAPSTPIDSPIKINMTFFMPIPKSKSKAWKRRALLGLELPDRKPDNDNLAKAILDAMNEIIYKDDARITDLNLKKRYSDVPRTEVVIIEQVTEVQAKLF